mmetsp:Transcript_8764/g.20065  ORF Transcript_8764/g.20065 Transcript_8764/m.20065 type:complete len:259 (-) Transcript_8764:1243-2019(-)
MIAVLAQSSSDRPGCVVTDGHSWREGGSQVWCWRVPVTNRCHKPVAAPARGDLEGQLARQDVEHCHADSPHVCRDGHAAFLQLPLLRTHELRRPPPRISSGPHCSGSSSRARGGAHKPEIDELVLALGVAHDVARLDVSVNEPSAVDELQTPQQHREGCQNLALLHRTTPQRVLKRLPVHVLHSQPEAAVVGQQAVVVTLHHARFRGEARQGSELATEAAQVRVGEAVSRPGPDLLEGNRLSAHAIPDEHHAPKRPAA